MGEVSGVTGVHDLHLWSVAGDDASLTAHVAIADGGDGEAIRRALTGMLETRFAIHHATIQTETEPCGDEESLHR
jgi:Co/Zn/Cd efflux system component